MYHLKVPAKMTKYQKFKLTVFSLFSLIFLIILYNFLITFNDYSSNGRYVRLDSVIILDTRTGTIYTPNSKTELYDPTKPDKIE